MRHYRVLDRWMHRHGTVTVFGLSVIPNPVFDIAGFMAGAVRMPIWRFAGTVFVGKAIKNFKSGVSGEDEIDVTPEADPGSEKNSEGKPKA